MNAIVMSHPTKGSLQVSLLSKLYEQKCQQLSKARSKGESLLSQVLNAEAIAIEQALRTCEGTLQ